MKFFENLLIRTKLFLSFGLVWIMLLVIVIIAFVTINNDIDTERELYDVHFQTSLTASLLRSYQVQNRADMLDMMLTSDNEKQNKIEQSIRDRSKEINVLLNKLKALTNDTIQENLLKRLDVVTVDYRLGRDKIFELILKGEINEARQLGTGNMSDRFEEIRLILTALTDKGINDTNDQVTTNIKRANSSIALFIALGVIALLLCILVIFLMNNLVAKPLVKISEIASNIALGDLSVKIKDDSRKDEVGILNRAFFNMANMLKKQLNDISNGINVLASSSTEIMASVSQLAASSSETATAVGETTTTVEEVKQTAIVSNNKAKMVSDNAFKMAEISADGNKAIENTIEGMSKIKMQMNAIAVMVVKLSEQSQTIGEITATVNELAEQSNLLAVNAAIEAAKAGEQGRGFTVVAQEIKQMANLSKDATAQVKTILRDIQKSISSAVMATEEGSKAVDEGLKLTNISGETIRTLSDSVTEASNAAIQIAASSQQQLEGMDQMVIAMESIREASLQAVASTQQSVESVNELQKVGQNLDMMMKQYKLK
jgi:methyl-accepting chemotaxis protein